MAISQTHVRSISLPSRLHSLSSSFETQLEKLKSSRLSVKSEAIQSALQMIAQLYNSFQENTQLSSWKSQDQDEKSLEERLSGSIELLDSCGAIRELFQTMKESIQALQSALRRKGLDSGVQNDVAEYFCCRKRMKRSIAKTLKNLKKSEQTMMKNDGNFTSVFRVLTGITVAVFKSLVMFLSLPTTLRASSRGWSLVAKALMIGKSGGENEVGEVEFALSSIQGKMRSDGARVVDVQKRLQDIEKIIEEFEGGLERLFRELVQIRVTFFNILTHN